MGCGRPDSSRADLRPVLLGAAFLPVRMPTEAAPPGRGSAGPSGSAPRVWAVEVDLAVARAAGQK